MNDIWQFMLYIIGLYECCQIICSPVLLVSCLYYSVVFLYTTACFIIFSEKCDFNNSKCALHIASVQYLMIKYEFLPVLDVMVQLMW